MDQSVNTKAIKFRALAEQRVTRVLRTLRRIGNLSRRQTYDYTPEQVEKMFEAMRAELDAAQAKFAHDKQQGVLFRWE